MPGVKYSLIITSLFQCLIWTCRDVDQVAHQNRAISIDWQKTMCIRKELTVLCVHISLSNRYHFIPVFHGLLVPVLCSFLCPLSIQCSPFSWCWLHAPIMCVFFKQKKKDYVLSVAFHFWSSANYKWCGAWTHHQKQLSNSSSVVPFSLFAEYKSLRTWLYHQWPCCQLKYIFSNLGKLRHRTEHIWVQPGLYSESVSETKRNYLELIILIIQNQWLIHYCLVFITASDTIGWMSLTIIQCWVT